MSNIPSFPLHAPIIDNNDKKNITKCLKTGWVSTTGNNINEFEKNISKIIKSKFVVALNSGTSALHLALKTIGIKENDEVIISTLTFIAPVNAVKYNGANPIFMDVDKHLNIDPEKTINFIKNQTYFSKGFSYNKKTKKIIRAIILVHVFGNLCNSNKLISLCKKRNIECIEDCAESFGSYLRLRNRNKFSGNIGKIGCFSFNGNKIITSGAGGAIATNSKKIYEKTLYLSKQAKNNQVEFIHNEIGYNYRMSNLLAALGNSQLLKLEKYITLKKKIHQNYRLAFTNNDHIELIKVPNYSESNYWINVIDIDFYFYNKKNLKQLILYLIKNKIYVRPLWFLNHLQKPFLKNQSYKIENANKLIHRCLCLPSSPNLSKKNIIYISKMIINYLDDK